MALYSSKRLNGDTLIYRGTQRLISVRYENTERIVSELNQQAEEIERLQAERETLIYDDIQSLARKNVELEQKIIDLEGSNPYTSQLVKRLQAEKDKLFNRANSLVIERDLLKRLVHLAWDVIAEDTNSPQLDTETFLKGYEAWVEANKFADGSDHAGVPVDNATAEAVE